MLFDGFLGCTQLRSNLLVEQTRGNQREYFALASRQRRMAGPECLRFADRCVRTMALLDRATYCFEQRFPVDWLFKEIHRTGLHRSHAGRYIGVAGNEYYREIRKFGANRLLQLEPIDSRHPQIRDK